MKKTLIENYYNHLCYSFYKVSSTFYLKLELEKYLSCLLFKAKLILVFYIASFFRRTLISPSAENSDDEEVRNCRGLSMHFLTKLGVCGNNRTT